ncbi:TRAP transporter small permease [Paracoccus seriniphilus]|uniref:TRAP transporter small permease n=1 Tax=Paracoccus seriniphilus TaxID=184748 RepID=UPI0035658886
MKSFLAATRLAERICLVSLLLGMTALFAFNIAMRLFGGAHASGFHWIDEVVRTMNIFMVFLAAGLALERGKHVAVDTWRDRIATSSRIPLRRIIDTAGVLFSLYMAWVAARTAAFVFASGQQSATLSMPIGWIYVAPSAGFVLLAIRYGASLMGAIDRFSPQSEVAE